jgi:Predicted dinucleotide-binding enzymes
MNITVLGTGMVGQTVSKRLVELGHKVTMGTRNPDSTLSRTEPDRMTGITFSEWHKANPQVCLVTFSESVKGADLIINATSGFASLEVLEMAGESALDGKVLLDISNPLDFSKGLPPSLFVCNTDSLGEQIQNRFSGLKVVKSLNTMNAYIQMNPGLLPGDHNVFISGNDKGAKAIVKDLLISIGWREQTIIDLGDITSARGTEMLLPIWVRLWSTFGNINFNFHIQQAK